ncbi:Ku protein [Aeromicrobium marinum DSM 15272]|uniref:Non-homologous end joining protein Ku n=1 Tax=Aeromicrobium marinum DSM 15272 TaxID=585531 RepID=E2S7U6_9ACTN|nr:Ku protein [Aeromicrobium marinum]EFQ84762.1 Ku protein [Aeromicrobium marinum DSM 15272]
MRSIWKGSISFGLVSVPVSLYSATSSHDVPLHQVHEADGGRIRYQRRCEVCGQVVEYDDITRAFDDGQRTVVLTEEELDELPARADHEIEVVEFVPAEQIDPIRLDRAYFLEPEARALKPYTLLRRALEDSDRSAVVTFSLRRRTRLGVLRVSEGVLLLQTLLWDDEIREAAFEVLDTTPRISAKERELAAAIVDSMASDFDPTDYADEYSEQLRALVESKLDADDTTAPARPTSQDDDGEGAEVVDLMEALQRSIDRSARKPARKKAPAKKATASKTSSKKSSTAKGTSKKTASKKKTTSKSTASKRTARGA